MQLSIYCFSPSPGNISKWSKRVGQQRVTRLVGLQKRQTSPQIDPNQLLVELQLEREKRMALEQEVAMLKEHLDQGSGAVVQLLQSEIDQAVSLKQTVMHGPDTLERFQEFSMGTVIEELKASCPKLYSLLKQLGNTDRNAREGVLPGEELKVVMALCTLLNAHSARIKGIQLLISLILIAKATSKQVCL